MSENFFWYLTRSSALIGYMLLLISIFLGLSIKIPILNRMVKPIYSYRIHCWISLQALIFSLIHGLSLLGDKYVNFSLGNIFIPYFPQNGGEVNANFLALGIISFYLMIILVVTSYFRGNISHSLWRAIHFLNVGLFVIVFIHSLYLGTDLQSGMLRFIFVYLNSFLAIIFLISLFLRLIRENNEDIR